MSARTSSRRRVVLSTKQRTLALRTRAPRLSERRRRRRMMVACACAALALMIAGGAVYALRLPQFSISSVTVAGTEYTDSASIQKTVDARLSGSYVWLIPHASALLFPKASIAKDIEKKFPSIAEVSVRRDSLTALAISITERTPVAVWCDAAHTCFLLDTSGLLFAPGSLANVPVYGGQIVGEPLGQVFLGGAFPTLDTEVQQLTRASARTPESVLIDEGNDVTVVLKEGGQIRFALKDDPSTLLDAIASTFASSDFKSGKTFEYVDFRFGNKVYVRWK